MFFYFILCSFHQLAPIPQLRNFYENLTEISDSKYVVRTPPNVFCLLLCRRIYPLVILLRHLIKLNSHNLKDIREVFVLTAVHTTFRIMSFVLKEVNGDLFSAKSSLANCVGADLKMGAGIALKFKQLFGGENELRKQNVSFHPLPPFILPWFFQDFSDGYVIFNLCFR